MRNKLCLLNSDPCSHRVISTGILNNLNSISHMEIDPVDVWRKNTHEIKVLSVQFWPVPASGYPPPSIWRAMSMTVYEQLWEGSGGTSEFSRLNPVVGKCMSVNPSSLPWLTHLYQGQCLWQLTDSYEKDRVVRQNPLGSTLSWESACRSTPALFPCCFIYNFWSDYNYLRTIMRGMGWYTKILSAQLCCDKVHVGQPQEEKKKTNTKKCNTTREM